MFVNICVAQVWKRRINLKWEVRCYSQAWDWEAMPKLEQIHVRLPYHSLILETWVFSRESLIKQKEVSGDPRRLFMVTRVDKKQKEFVTCLDLVDCLVQMEHIQHHVKRVLSSTTSLPCLNHGGEGVCAFSLLSWPWIRTFMRTEMVFISYLGVVT